MEEYYLIKPQQSDEKAVTELITKWNAFGGRMNPGLLTHFEGDYTEWLRYLDRWENGVGIGEEVPQTLYLLKEHTGVILDAVSIRHSLNHTNLTDGGHLGYGICPEFRGKGYGNLLLTRALKKLLEMGIRRVLITCDHDNYPSQKVILSHGGILKKQMIDENGILVNRYWVDNIE